MTNVRSCRFAWLLVLLTCAAAPLYAEPFTIPDGATVRSDAWFVLHLQGQRVGHARELVYEQDEQLVGVNIVQMKLDRGIATIRMDQFSKAVETAEHEPVRLVNEGNAAGMAVFSELVFDQANQKIEVTQKQFGMPFTQTVDWPQGDWMTPIAYTDYVKKQVRAGAEEIRALLLDGQNGATPTQHVMKRQGQTNVELIGETVPAIAWTITSSQMPNMQMQAFTNEKGDMLKVDIPLMPGMAFTMIRTDRELATLPVEQIEIMAQTFIASSRAIADPREVTFAQYRLAPRQTGDLVDVQLPQTAVQTVERDGPDLLVTVNLNADKQPQSLTNPQAMLQRSVMLDKDDPVVQEMVQEALGEDGTSLSIQQKALRLCAYVHEAIEGKNLSVGFATAGETARTRQGDCTEHAVLLAALLRAAGIPSRCVSGIVYADGFMGSRQVFAYHMWAQAWSADPQAADEPGIWMDLDAAIPTGDPDRPFDATHIALAVHDMNEPEMVNLMVPLLPLMNRFDVQVLKTTHP